MGKPNRIREWREKRDLSLEALADLADISSSYLSRMETGDRNVSLKNLAKISGALKVAERELVPDARRTVPVVGYVSAGAETHFFDQEQTTLDEVTAPDGATEKSVAVEIRGDSLGSFFDKWIAHYDDVRKPVTPDLIGHLCIVRLEDGRTVIKKIKRGTSDGLWTLLSQFEAPMYDEEVEFAARITSLVPK